MEADRDAGALEDARSLDRLPEATGLVGVQQGDVGGSGADDVARVGERVGTFVERDRHAGLGAERGVAGKVIQFQWLLDIGWIKGRQLLQLPLRRAGRPRTIDVEAKRQ